MADDRPPGEGTALPGSAPAAPLAPVLMMVFWMRLDGAPGIRIAQSLWHLLGLGAGRVGVAVPVGGALVGLISNPRLLVLLMAAFAGSAAGAVAGKVAWGEVGEIGGPVAGGLVGAIAWATWLYLGRDRDQAAPVTVRHGRGEGGGDQ